MRTRSRRCLGVAWWLALAGVVLPGVPGRICRAAIPDHVVVVIEENRDYGNIVGSASAPFLNQLAHDGLLFTNSHAIEHPSQPNYLDLFSGGNQGVTDSSRHPAVDAANLASELRAAKRTFAGYSLGMPADGFDGDAFPVDGSQYVRRHNPFTQFTNLTVGGTNAAVNKTLDPANFPTARGTDYSFLPTVSFVVPDLLHDMHEQPPFVYPDPGVIAGGDTWLRDNLGWYANWATSHRSLLIVTWDEGDRTPDNHIATIVTGDPLLVRAGISEQRVNHFSLLRTIEDLYRSQLAGASATAAPFARDGTGAFAADALWGDVNRNGAVDFADLLMAGQHYGVAPGATWSSGDLTGDGRVDLSDLLLIAQNYGRRMTNPPSVGAVPEPGVGVLAGVWLLLAGAKHRRMTRTVTMAHCRVHGVGGTISSRCP
jgi:hypothetical protein